MYGMTETEIPNFPQQLKQKVRMLIQIEST